MSLIDFRALPLIQEYLEVLACIVRADRRFDAAEIEALRQACATSGLSQRVVDHINELLDPARSVNVEAILRGATRGASPALLAELLRDGYIMAMVDGDVSAPETALLDQLLATAGVGEGQRAELHRWAQTAATHHVQGLRLLKAALGEAKR